jgi:hypothetical protein
MPSDDRSDGGPIPERVVRAARQYHLAPGANLPHRSVAPTNAVADADGALPVQQDFRPMGPGADLEILPLRRRVQKHAGRADPAAIENGSLSVGDALLGTAVVVGIAWDAVLNSALDERLAQGMAPVDVGNDELAIPSAVGIVARANAPLHPPEVGQHIGVAPAPVTLLGPCVEIQRLAAVIDVSVDGTRAAQGLAPGRVDPPPARPGAGLHAVVPVDAAIVEGLDEAGRDMDVGMPVPAPGFEHADAGIAFGAQPVCEHAPGGAGAHDHVVEGIH